QKLVAITAAMPSGTGLSHFAKAHPGRYFDVGIAEEHATLFACGLATQGMTPFLTIYSTFFQRAYDMAIHDIAIQRLNVRLCMDRAGLSGDDGPTHHGLFDIGYLRHIPNWVHMQPKNEDEFVDMLWTMAHYNAGPIAVRYPRGSNPAQETRHHRGCARGKGAPPLTQKIYCPADRGLIQARRYSRRNRKPLRCGLRFGQSPWAAHETRMPMLTSRRRGLDCRP